MTQEVDKPQQPSNDSARAPALNRRRFITDSGLVMAAAFVPSALRSAWAEDHGRADSPFTLGVASGDPTSHAVTLWTRLAEDPLQGGGMRERELHVQWKVALDPAMRRVVKAGEVAARPASGHAVNVRVSGLEPDRWYYYQFKHRGARSRIGRTRTFPRDGARVDRLRFALVSCQDYEAGYYAAYRDMLGQELDFVLHVGDYIYEYGANPSVPAERRHTGQEIVSLSDYRNRYALYRLDSDLQNAHAAYPFVCTWDDHEVDNNYASLIPEDDQTAQAFFARRRTAYQVYRETMPLAPRVRLSAGNMNLYRELQFGKLARFLVLDSRQYRTDQPCGDGLQVLQACPQILDPQATLLGPEQEAWMNRRLKDSRATWNVLAQQVMMMRWDLGVLTGQPVNFFNVDAWDGYQIARNRVMQFLHDERIANPVVLTGDIHSSWAADLKTDFTDAQAPVVGAEFVCSGITSVFGDGNHALVQATLPSNPHIKFFDGLHRGYAICTVAPDQWRTDFRAVTRVADPVFTVPAADIPLFTQASYGLIAGQPGLNRLL